MNTGACHIFPVSSKYPFRFADVESGIFSAGKFPCHGLCHCPGRLPVGKRYIARNPGDNRLADDFVLPMEYVIAPAVAGTEHNGPVFVSVLS